MAKKRGTKAGIEGGKELADKFKAISRAAQNKVEEALQKGALKVERDAKSLAPVDTGRLVNSISHRLTEDGDSIIAEVGTNLEYAKFVEYGTGQLGENSADNPPEGISYGSHIGGFAQPFLFPAYNQNKNKIKEDIAKAVMQAAKG